MEKQLDSKGYDVILSISKKGITPDKPVDFSDVLKELGKVVEK